MNDLMTMLTIIGQLAKTRVLCVIKNRAHIGGDELWARPA